MLEKAIYIQFPLESGNFYTYPDSFNITKLPLTRADMYLNTYPNNAHHIKPDILFNKIMPILANLLKFDFNPNDFTLKQVSNTSRHILMAYPNTEQKYNCKSLYRDNDVFENIDYEKLLDTASHDASTRWHQLYKFGHESSIVENITNQNNRKLLIVGDSQMIPLVTMLSVYFQHITYIDNRKRQKILDKINDIEYTDVLIQFFNGTVNHYIDMLM